MCWKPAWPTQQPQKSLKWSAGSHPRGSTHESCTRPLQLVWRKAQKVSTHTHTHKGLETGAQSFHIQRFFFPSPNRRLRQTPDPSQLESSETALSSRGPFLTESEARRKPCFAIQGRKIRGFLSPASFLADLEYCSHFWPNSQATDLREAAGGFWKCSPVRLFCPQKLGGCCLGL